MATKREDCTRDKFSQRLDPKYGYFVKNCNDERERRMLAFLVPIFSPEKPYNITLTLATTLLLAYSEKKVVDWGSIIGELVHKLATNTKCGQPSYIGLSSTTCTHTETYSLMKRRPNRHRISSCESFRLLTRSRRWVTRVRRRTTWWSLATKSGP